MPIFLVLGCEPPVVGAPASRVRSVDQIAPFPVGAHC
jgi:hypothetical protein